MPKDRKEELEKAFIEICPYCECDLDSTLYAFCPRCGGLIPDDLPDDVTIEQPF